MHISQNLEYLYKLNRLGIKTSLDNIRKLCRALGDPMLKYPVIHIAGTNGKGTTAAMLQNIFVTSGYRCGLYTSPHLRNFGERIRIGNELLSDEEASDYINELRPIFEKTESTFFESTTAMAFLHFARRDVDAAIIEVGLGGTWDATNVVNPMLAVFTPISLDHTERLGTETGSIARDKAHIIKSGAKVVSSLQDESAFAEINRRADTLGCEFHYAPDCFKICSGNVSQKFSTVEFSAEKYPELSGKYNIPLPGKHQWINAQTVLTAASLIDGNGFNLSTKSIKTGIESVFWGGRLQLLQEQPIVYYDAGHNPAAAKVITEFFREVFPKRKIKVMMGIVREKDSRGILYELANIAGDFTFTGLPSERSLEPEILAAEATGLGLAVRIIPSPAAALETILQETHDQEIVLIIGSHYLGQPILNKYLT